MLITSRYLDLLYSELSALKNALHQQCYAVFCWDVLPRELEAETSCRHFATQSWSHPSLSPYRMEIVSHSHVRNLLYRRGCMIVDENREHCRRGTEE